MTRSTDADCVVYQSPRFAVCAAELPTRDGDAATRHYVRTRDAVVVFPLLDPETVVLIRNERFAVGQMLWELPAGTLEPGEDPAECAARELREEAGYNAADLSRLTAFHPSPGVVSEHMTAFLATGLTHVGQSLDPTERITPQAVPRIESMEMIRDGRIRDGKTLAMLLFYERFVAAPG